MSEYNLEDLKANIRTHIPDFDMATEIMKRLSELAAERAKVNELQDQNAAIREVLEKEEVEHVRTVINNSINIHDILKKRQIACDKCIDKSHRYSLGKDTSLTPSEAAELVKQKDEADYAYDADNWESTHPWPENSYYLFDDLPCLEIMEVGFLKELPSKFYVKFYNEENDNYEDRSFNTKKEAQEAIEAARAAGVGVE